MDPGPHHQMPNPFLRAQEQQGYHSSSNSGANSGGTGSRRGGDGAPHHFHGPPPAGWIESQAAAPRGQQQQQQQQRPTPSPTASNSSNPLRRSPRGNPATFHRFENGNSFPPPPQHHHHGMHLSSGGGGPPPGHHHGSTSQQQQQQQQRGVPSPRGGPVGAGRGPPPIRSLPPNGHGGGGPRRRPEHLMVGPLGDPMFVGSPGTMGGMGMGGGEGGLGMETVSRVLIPNCKIGAVIGKGGAIIKHIREVRHIHRREIERTNGSVIDTLSPCHDNKNRRKEEVASPQLVGVPVSSCVVSLCGSPFFCRDIFVHAQG